jgi:hypothetical protein
MRGTPYGRVARLKVSIRRGDAEKAKRFGRQGAASFIRTTRHQGAALTLTVCLSKAITCRVSEEISERLATGGIVPASTNAR